MGQYAGSVITFEQRVGHSVSGSLIAFEQTIAHKNSYSGSVISFEQTVKGFYTGSVVKFEQTIRNPSIKTNVSRFGWDAHLYIDGVEVDHNMMHGMIEITRNENSAALMNVTLINKTGAIDLTEYHGKAVILDIETASGLHRAYTGVVDVPEFDLINKLITLRCTDKRKEQINNQLGPQLKFIGYWSEAIFEKPSDVAAELENRLMTTTKTVDFDAYGNYTISDYLPKSTADFVFNDAKIYRRNPTLQVASRARLVNRINIEFEYRYVRLRHRQRTFRLDGPTFCDVMTTVGLSFLKTDGIKSNLQSFGWNVDMNSIVYDYLPPAGWYSCDKWGSKFLWSPRQEFVSTKGKVDANGNPVTDSSGNQVQEVTSRTVIDRTKEFATGATWNAAKQFAQNVSQKFSIQINAPQSQSQYGVIEKTMRHGLDVEFDATDFEQQDNYQPAPADFTQTATDSYKDENGDPSDFYNAINTVIAMAKTEITKSHRDNHVTIQVPIMPEIDLRHTVETTAGVINARGKVSAIRHVLDITERFSETAITFSMSQAVGSQIDDNINIPLTTPPLIGDSYTGTYLMKTYGEIGGGLLIGENSRPIRELGMITPDIDDESRNTQTTESSYTFSVSIRNDLLSVNY